MNAARALASGNVFARLAIPCPSQAIEPKRRPERHLPPLILTRTNDFILVTGFQPGTFTKAGELGSTLLGGECDDDRPHTLWT